MNDCQHGQPPGSAAPIRSQCLGARGSRRAFAIACGTLILGGALGLVYGPAAHAPFIFDDRSTIVENPSIVQLWPLWGGGERGGPLNPPPGLPTSARPLVNLSLALNYHWGRLDPTGYHVFNTAVHALSALLLWAVVRRTLSLDYFRGAFDRVAGMLSLLAALIWAVHPLNTECVAYITQRTESMMGFFYLATLYASLNYWEAKTRPARATWLIVATAASLLGMISKEMMASAIAMVLLFERTFIAGTFRAAWRKSWPLYLGLALGWIPILAINWHGPQTPAAGFHLGVPAHVWWLTQTEVLLIYLRLAVWPWPLVIHYEIPYLATVGAAWPWLLPVALGIVATLALVWRRAAVGFVGAWVLAVLSPTLLVPLAGETLVERRMYVPLMALVPLAIAGGFAALEWLTGKLAAKNPGWRLGWAASSATVLAGLGLSGVFMLVSIRRLASYQDELTLWQDALVHQPHDPLIRVNAGTALAGRGRPREAVEQFEEALRLSPAVSTDHLSSMHFNLARAFTELGQPQEALPHYELAVRLKPAFADAQYNLGLALDAVGRTREAIDHFAEAVRLKPDFAAAHNNLGIALAGSGHVAEGIDHFERALQLEPDVEGYANLAFAYALVGRHGEAVAKGEQAADLARSQGKAKLAAELETWLRSFRNRPPSP